MVINLLSIFVCVFQGYVDLRSLRGTQWFVSAEYLFGRNRLTYSDLIAVKTGDFFGETSPQTFVTRGLINSYCFWRDKINMLLTSVRE